VDVVLPADGAGIAQPLCHPIDHPYQVPLCLFLRPGRAQVPECAGRQHGPDPGSEILGGHVLPAADLLQVVVDVPGIHRLAPALVVQILEQLLARQRLAVLHDSRDPAVGDRDRVTHPALASETEAEVGSRDRHMSPLERGEPVGTVFLGVFGVAYPDQGLLEQPDHGGQHFGAGKTRAGQVLLHPAPDLGQHLAELEHPPELGLVSNLAVLGVVAVLLPALGVPCRGLDMAVGGRADPDVFPCRRDDQRADPGQNFRVLDHLTIGSQKAEPAADALPPDAGERVAHVPEPGGMG